MYWSPAAPVSSVRRSCGPWSRPGTRRWSSTPCSPRRTAGPPPRPEVRTGSSWRTCGTARRSTVRCGASTRCATRRRWSVSARTSRTHRTTWGATTSGQPCCSLRWRGRGCGVWWSRARWWCTGRAGTTAGGTGLCGPDHARRPTSTPAGSSLAAPPARRSWCPGSSMRTRRWTRATCMRRPSSPRSTWRPRGHGRRAAARCRCAATTCTDRACRVTPRTPGSPPSSVRRWAGASRPASSRTAASGGTSSMYGTWPPRTWWLCGRSRNAGRAPRRVQHRERAAPHYRRDGRGPGLGLRGPGPGGHR